MAKTKAPPRERTAPHPLNRHLFVVDNLKLLRSLETDSVDLVVTDPPFGKNATFTSDGLKPKLRPEELDAERELLATWGIASPEEARRAGVEWTTDRRGASYDDTWRWKRDVHDEWMLRAKTSHERVWHVLRAALAVHSEGHGAYLAYMAVRLIEIRRVLKPTGSIYLHCDHTAGHYIKLLMDAIFGKKNFINEIVWCYTSPTKATRHFKRKHDVIFLYSGGGEYTFNVQHLPAKRMTGMGKTSFAALNQNPADFKKMEEELTKRGKVAEDWWTDIGSGSHMPKNERVGYPTQKPKALAERMIKASSNPGDVVLDPFAGCAYVPVAADNLDRQWIACDISIRAQTVIDRQFDKFVFTDGEMKEGYVTVRGPNDLPERAPDPEGEKTYEEIADLEFGEFDYFGKLFEDHEAKAELLEASDYRCWACGFANRYEDGEVIRKPGNFHLDHVDPSVDGGLDYIYNRAPLCAECNLYKNRRHITLRALRGEVAKRGNLGVRDERLLPDIAKMQKAAADLYARRWAERKAELGF